MEGNIRNKINVAVWGLGKHTCKNILPALNECKSISLKGVYSRNKQVVDESVSRYRCGTWNSIDTMLSDDSVDAIYLSTPIGLHVEQGLKILAANKHFWCEKPIVFNLQDAHELVDLAKKKKLTLNEGFMYEYHPQFQWLKKYINEIGLASIKSIRCRFGLPFLDEPGFRYTAALGGSALLDVGCYTLSAILDLIPDIEPVLKYLKINVPEASEIDMDGSAILNIEDNIDVFLEWGYGRDYKNEIDIWGSGGTLYTDKIFSKPSDYEPSFILSDKNGKKSQIACESGNHFIAMFDYFGEMIGNDTIAELEYGRILRRARYLSELFEESKSTKHYILKKGKNMQKWQDVKLDDETMWPKEGVIELEKPHVDDRGYIQSLVNFPMKNLSLIMSKKGTVRSNHYHETDWHYMYVLSGKFDYYFRPTGSDQELEKITVVEGEMVFTPPMEDHATVFLEDTKLLAMSRNPRDQATYESDVHRVELINPASISL